MKTIVEKISICVRHRKLSDSQMIIWLETDDQMGQKKSSEKYVYDGVKAKWSLLKNEELKELSEQRVYTGLADTYLSGMRVEDLISNNIVATESELW